MSLQELKQKLPLTFVVVSLCLSISSLSYSFIVFNRALMTEAQSTHVGLDTIVIAYLTPLFAVILAVIATNYKMLIKVLRQVVWSLSLLALSIWLYLHFSGNVISHQS